jgi:hypothetical protein
MPVSKDAQEYVPIQLPLWGQQEPLEALAHFHFVFHALNGFLLGGAAYPLHDTPTRLVEFGRFPLSAHVRWFTGHSFDSSQEEKPVDWKTKLLHFIPRNAPTTHTPLVLVPKASSLHRAVRWEAFLGWMGIVLILSSAFWYLVLIWLPQLLVILKQGRDKKHQ